MVVESKTEDSNTKPQYSRLFKKIVLTLENCLLPAKKLEETPSQIDGLNKDTEKDLRILGCELIQTAGILLHLPQVAMATGQILFQRFFYSKSFVRHNMEITAMSCICLASKIEEAPRRIRDVINVLHHIKQVRAQKEITPMVLDQNYTVLKTQVIKAERRVLKELGFCVHVKHPHKLIVMYLQVLGYEKNENFMQMAWNFMNDSLRTDVFMRYQPETIACACIYLTARKQNIPLPSNPPWYGIFKVTEEQIIDICYRILDLYRRQKPNVEKLEDAVEELKKKYIESRNKKIEQNNQSIQSSKITTVMTTVTTSTVIATATAATTSTTTTVDRSNGSHNAWGGFISRTLPQTTTSTSASTSNEISGKSSPKMSSRSSRSQSRSHTPTDHHHHRHHKSRISLSSSSSKRKHKSKSPKSSSSCRKKSRNYSRSPSSSSSPSHQLKHKKNHKSSRERSEHHYSNGDKKDKKQNNGGDRDRSRGNDRNNRSKERSNSNKYDRYSSSSSTGQNNPHRSSSKRHEQDRSHDRKR